MSSSKPLKDYFVVEVGNSVAGPYAGLILAELGADVVKIESPNGGDFARGWGPPFWDGSAPHFITLNRNKRGLTADLSDARERDALERLILEKADAVIFNLRPGMATERGLGPEKLLALKPALVYCDIGAFGRGGPMSDKPGYDPLMQAYSGLMSITGEDETRPPIRNPLATIDMGSGLWAAVGILASLLERKTTGKGGLVETSLFETALAYTTIQLASVTITPRQMKPQGSGASGIVPYQAFRAADGWIVIGGGNDGLYAKLVKALGRPELAADPRFVTNADRVKSRLVLIPILEEEIAKHSIVQVREIMDTHGVPNAPVQRLDQVLADEQVAALGILQQGPEGALPTMGLPLRFDGVRPSYERAAPRLGADGSVLKIEK
ncbi:MAG: formyl-coenzyme transferase (Formyl-CoA transferase)-like protein [Betaproteobacteria bacterium]|nr:formyl-coenzyme transferase (Formyl-CoA transferase)-like protein [Betaproteobacteria bacterium]